MASFFLGEARKSGHLFPEERRDELIYSATIVDSGKSDWIYEQVYVFCPTDQAICVSGAEGRAVSGWGWRGSARGAGR
jgi:hypothetical protein